MVKSKSKLFRTLAVAPSTRGVGFAVLDGGTLLADWGVKIIEGNKNTSSIARVVDLIGQAQPDLLVLENARVKDSRRSQRVRELLENIIQVAKGRSLPVKLISRAHVKDTIAFEGGRTKQDIAEALANRFPEQLATQLPERRRAWESEDYQMPAFDAVALAVTSQAKNQG